VSNSCKSAVAHNVVLVFIVFSYIVYAPAQTPDIWYA